jgi:outer membrane cobalamin receptor
MAEPLSQTLASATVIDRASIEARQFQTLDEVLATAPGVALTNNGGVGKLSTLFIRGAEADQNLVLINGVRIGSTTAGIAAIQDIPIEQIERIEIVRGPRSALYGADALGGVVQVFTRSAAAGGDVAAAVLGRFWFQRHAPGRRWHRSAWRARPFPDRCEPARDRRHERLPGLRLPGVRRLLHG